MRKQTLCTKRQKSSNFSLSVSTPTKIVQMRGIRVTTAVIARIKEARSILPDNLLWGFR